MPQTSKWQTHLPYLQLEPLLVHKSLLFPWQSLYEPAVADAILGSQASYALVPWKESFITSCGTQVPLMCQ